MIDYDSTNRLGAILTYANFIMRSTQNTAGLTKCNVMFCFSKKRRFNPEADIASVTAGNQCRARKIRIHALFVLSSAVCYPIQLLLLNLIFFATIMLEIVRDYI